MEVDWKMVKGKRVVHLVINVLIYKQNDTVVFILKPYEEVEILEDKDLTVNIICMKHEEIVNAIN